MKKEYRMPETTVLNVELQNMIAASGLSIQGGSADKNGTVLSRGGDFWDDEEED